MGVVPGKDYQIAYSGKHDTSALAGCGKNW
jgi:hypothetical protein